MISRYSLFLTMIVLGMCLMSAAPSQCLQNPDFASASGWQLSQGGTSGTARVLGGFLDLSVSFPNDFAQARQQCSSPSAIRTLEVDVDDFGIGTIKFQMGWENGAGTSGDYVTVTRAQDAVITTTNPAHTWVVFRADGDPNVLGASAQMLDNVVVTSITPPAPDDIVDHLLYDTPPPDHANLNDDGQIDAADLVMSVNMKNE